MVYYDTFNVPHHFPQFLWASWLARGTTKDSEGAATRIHAYDVYSNELTESHSPTDGPNASERPVFHDLSRIAVYAGARQALERAEQAFASLQSQVEAILKDITNRIHVNPISQTIQTTISAYPISSKDLAALSKFFVFLRFRNSIKYREMVHALEDHGIFIVHSGSSDLWNGDVTWRPRKEVQAPCRLAKEYTPLFQQVWSQRVLNQFAKFFGADPSDEPVPLVQREPPDTKDPFQALIDTYLWQPWRGAELCMGISEDQEFILPGGCFGILDERFGWGGEETEPSKECFDCFFPITPTVCLYLFEGHSDYTTLSTPSGSMSSIDIGIEQSSDVYLRNAMILSAIPYTHNAQATSFSSSSSLSPSAFDPDYTEVQSIIRDKRPRSSGPKLYFSSLSSITKTISAYEEFRCQWFAEQFTDYSRLKQRCRQKFCVEALMKTLPVGVKDDVTVFDLTNEIEIVGDHAKAFGAFSDVWMGKWWDGVERKDRVVAIKFLRPCMVQNVRAKVLKRLQDEVITWHRLCNRNIAPLYGLVQNTTSIGMVSQWCDNGTIVNYLKANPSADRLKLIRQIASAVQYLHSARPVVVHGDLKGGNILVDGRGQAIITDFGLSKVMESVPEMAMSSVLAGSLRWMAPELLIAAVEDNIPHLTVHSDVYAFGAVCLELITDKLPYPCRTNDAAVTLDIMNGIKPSRGALISCEKMPIRRCRGRTGVATTGATLKGKQQSAEDMFVEMMDSCWDQIPECRPTMDDVLSLLGALESDE